jgi:hypothetical protein
MTTRVARTCVGADADVRVVALFARKIKWVREKLAHAHQAAGLPQESESIQRKENER